MPYKDQKKQAAAMKRIRAKWSAENPDKVALTAHKSHQNLRAKRLERMRINNRKRGHAERPKGPKARVELDLPVTRKWAIFTDRDGVTRLYFTSKKGFELSEVKQIVKEFTEARKRVLESQLQV